MIDFISICEGTACKVWIERLVLCVCVCVCAHACTPAIPEKNLPRLPPTA